MMNIGDIFSPYKIFNGSLVPNWIMRRKEISSTSKLLYGRLSQYSGKSGNCFPSRKSLSKELGVSIIRIDRAIKQLKECGLIKTKQRGLSKSSRYFFMWQKWCKERTKRHEK